MKHQIVETSYGEVMVKETTEKGYLDCYIGDNYDSYLCTIEGNVYDSEDSLAESIEACLGA
jgi:hypothetical protein